MSNRAYMAIDASVAAAAAQTKDIDVGSADTLLVAWLVTDSGATADLGATTVRPYTAFSDSAAGILIENTIPAVSVAAVAKTGAQTSKLDRYDVRGLERVRLSMTNAAGGAKTLQAHVYLDN